MKSKFTVTAVLAAALVAFLSVSMPARAEADQPADASCCGKTSEDGKASR